MALGTVTEVITDARVLLQDTEVDYRYTDAELLVYLNAALMEARKLRPDFFLTTSGTVPNFTVVNATDIGVDQQYRSSIVYYIVGRAQLRDEEDTSDARAGAMLKKFAFDLTGAVA